MPLASLVHDVTIGKIVYVSLLVKRHLPRPWSSGH
jgi:hypothetical protein